MAQVRVGVVGVGHLGKEHARILAGLQGVELVGVADVHLDQAQAIARRHGCLAFGNHRPLMHLVDAAVIAVPTTYHFAIAAEFLRGGIPLLVEKPLAATLEQAESLVELARRHQVILQVGHIERFNPAWEDLGRHRIQPRFIECERMGPFTGRSTDIGVVLDLMIHDLDLLQTLVQSRTTAVEALGIALFGDHEDIAQARLKFANGCVANLSASRVNQTPERRMRIWSPEGFITLDFAKKRITYVQLSEQIRRHGLDPTKLNSAALAMLKDDLFGRHMQVLDCDCSGGPDGLTRELQEFTRCVRTGSWPRVSGEDGRDAIALATTVLNSLQHHAWNGNASEPMGPHQLPSPVDLLFHPAARDVAA